MQRDLRARSLTLFLSPALSLRQRTLIIIIFVFFFCTGGDRKMLPASRRCLARRLSFGGPARISVFRSQWAPLGPEPGRGHSCAVLELELELCNDFQTPHSWASPVFLFGFASPRKSRIIISYFDLLFCLLFCNTFAAAAKSFSFYCDFFVFFLAMPLLSLLPIPMLPGAGFLRFAPLCNYYANSVQRFLR